MGWCSPCSAFALYGILRRRSGRRGRAPTSAAGSRSTSRLRAGHASISGKHGESDEHLGRRISRLGTVSVTSGRLRQPTVGPMVSQVGTSCKRAIRLAKHRHAARSSLRRTKRPPRGTTCTRPLHACASRGCDRESTTRPDWSAALWRLGRTLRQQQTGCATNSTGKQTLDRVRSSDCSYKLRRQERMAWPTSASSRGTQTKPMMIDGRSSSTGISKMETTSDRLQYTGNGTLYVNGTVDFRRQVCGPETRLRRSAATCSQDLGPERKRSLIVALNSGGTPPSRLPYVNGSGPKSTPVPGYDEVRET